jgi:hypothetical protein
MCSAVLLDIAQELKKKNTQAVKTTPHMKLRKVSHFGTDTVKLLYRQTKMAQSESLQEFSFCRQCLLKYLLNYRLKARV